MSKSKRTMSFKFILCISILLFATMILVTEARGGRGRGGSFGSTFYRRSYKKNNNGPSSRSSRRKVVSGSPVHTSYTQSLIAADAIDVKFGKRSRTHRKSSGGHSSGSGVGHSSIGHSSSGGFDSHSNSKHVDTAHNTHNLFGRPPQHLNIHQNAHNYNLLGPRNSYHNSPHISQNWGGHQLPPDHVHITQPSSIPTHAVYYAQPPVYSSASGGSKDFVMGYLVGNSFTHHHHHHKHDSYSHQHDTSHHSYNAYAEDNTPYSTSTDVVSSSTAPTVHYWPTDTEVSLAPLNNTLLSVELTQTTQPAIFKGPPKLSAQKLTINNSTIELPAATAPPPETPPANGIICMPWSFNETDPTNPEHIVVVEKVICFPAPPPPPTTTLAPSTPAPVTAPVAGDIGVDVAASTQKPKDKCQDVVCPTSIFEIDMSKTDPCCFAEDKIQALAHNYMFG